MIHSIVLAAVAATIGAAEPTLVRSADSGPWSAASTWEGGRAPGAGDRVLVREGHHVLYDVDSATVIRAVHVSGVLRFATDRDTRLDVGLLRVQPGDDVSEEGFECAPHAAKPADSGQAASTPTAALEVGTADEPIVAGRRALIRLTYIEGMDKESFPAIVACGGRMEFHGAPMARTWVKLQRTADVNQTLVFLNEPVEGWKPGDRVILTGTTRHLGYGGTYTDSVRDQPSTEERTITKLAISQFNGIPSLTVDAPLKFDHRVIEDYRGEVANLSRNVVIESADPKGVRGHVMYHKRSAGSISYGEFRHLGKEGVLGRYSLHFHLAGNSMRGTSVVGASFWDSANRWITIHGTNYLVVRDCVGYRSVGHGFFLEDGTEVYNVFDRCLAVQACLGRPLPKQVLPFDHNDGAGFWWANSLNTFTRNVAAECDQYGYRFEARKTADFDPELNVMQPDGSYKVVDIRTLPFVRFEGNEAHCHRRFGVNLGGFKGVARDEDKYEDVKSGDVQGVGPDPGHPFMIRDTKLWNCHWPFHAGSPTVKVDDMSIYDCEYGLWRSNTRRHVYNNLEMRVIRSHSIFHPWGGFPTAGEGYEQNLKPVDDLPPATAITGVSASGPSRVVVRGTASENGAVAKVLVNGRPARSVRGRFDEWEVEIDGVGGDGIDLSAHAEDVAGNVEKLPHVVHFPIDPNDAIANPKGRAASR
ncbi:G8 domain-containing protein [Paludisphaera borealis]|uniref:G8 domain-containing protein n=1 Tax=Paludisphaera borealis TaxID=1387353 RepID=A0A1U7CRJ5_9BACT|nr:G8 domain-containing protein [Paludisphaera borealis]APW61567.1 hypothetical protein BSF38_03085 [Paludisphaera borealis]